ncbi:MAG: bifunctional oligoribonuclease/PAP phosphatase NrnA [Candidatus Cloacimonetes bacterium]|nr:bifunctional oligoribonuclease/PAP phosphatase NrnA [Candidatus Cloacimonadota bacterium]
MKIDEFKFEFRKIIDNNKNFILTTHENPDGDGIGAQFALFLYLKQLGKNIKIINQDKPLSKYHFLGLSDKVQTKVINSADYIIIMLDFNEKKRVGQKIQKIFDNYKNLICIDHHKEPEELTNSISYIDIYSSSTCEIIYLLLKDEINNFSSIWKQKFANFLYTGLIYDTNNFANSNVKPVTFSIASKLIELGANNNLCYLNLFENRSLSELRLLGETLSSIEEYFDSKVVCYLTSQKMLKDCNVDMELTSGFSKEVKPTDEHEVIIYFRELNKNHYRCSLRSKNLNVQKIAKNYDGGGHRHAAGFEVEMELQELKEKLVELIRVCP